ncbi:MAG: hypothetical protein J0H49_10715 [Acidobacteria bacterium]|nr:hypothetical protein [Acidobacteriota bacterium]
MDLKKLIESRHPDYTLMAPVWKFLSDCAEADPRWPQMINPLAVNIQVSAGNYVGLRNYVGQFPKESNKNYLGRISKAVPVDICGPGVGMYAGTVGAPKTVSMDIPASYQNIMADFDCQGNDFHAFMYAAREMACVFGVSYIVVDAPSSTVELRTQADVLSAGVRPYARLINPLSLLNWRLDQYGEPQEVLYQVADLKASMLEDSEVKSYRYWTPEEWFSIESRGDSDIRVIDQGKNPIGRVPIVPLYHVRKAPFKGQSLIRIAAKYMVLLSNWLSSADSVIQAQSFAIPVLRTDDKVPELDLSTSAAILLTADKDKNVGFEYVSPDPAGLESAWTIFVDTYRLALKALGIQGDPIQDKATAESGVARSYKHDEANRRLVSMALNEQQTAALVMDLMAAFQGESEFIGSITYGTKFDLNDLQSAIDNLLKLSTVGLPPAARQELLRDVLSKALPSLPAKRQKEIDDQIEAIPAIAAAVRDVTVKN